MSKFTPGPWYYGVAYEPERGQQAPSYRGHGYSDNAGILSASGETIVGCDEYDIFGPIMVQDGERDANVRLISASPEMYEALAAAIPVLEARAPDFNVLNESIRAILAKVDAE